MHTFMKMRLLSWRQRRNIILRLFQQLIFESILMHQPLIRINPIENVTAGAGLRVSLHVLNYVGVLAEAEFVGLVRLDQPLPMHFLQIKRQSILIQSGTCLSGT